MLMKVATKKDKMETQTGARKGNKNDTTTPKTIRPVEGKQNIGEAGTKIGSWHDDFVGARDARITPDDRLEDARNATADPKKRVKEVARAMQADADQAEEHDIDDDSTNKDEVEEAIDEAEEVGDSEEAAEEEAEPEPKVRPHTKKAAEKAAKKRARR
jgi:hypothetical protein